MKLRLALISLFLLLSACAPTPTAAPVSQANVYASAAAGPWLSEAFDCASNLNLALNVVTDPVQADLILRIGEPAGLTTPAFQIDTEEILVVTHRESPLQNMTLEQVQSLFANGDPSVQVWVYPAGEDVQRVFDQLVMAGRPVTSSARMASSPQEMSDVLNAQSNAVGILPRHWLAGTPRFIYSVGNVPVLAVTQSEPQGALKNLIACLQK
jgi:hypothetical protein